MARYCGDRIRITPKRESTYRRKGTNAMTSRLEKRRMGVWGLAAALLLGVGLGSARAVDEGEETRRQLLELTGGTRVKVVWHQDDMIKLYDTMVGVTEELPLPGVRR
jgi:hypothetical protein